LSPVTVVDCKLAKSPVTSVLSILRRLRLALMSVCPHSLGFSVLGPVEYLPFPFFCFFSHS
jgi:hypothetical protein